MIFENPATEAKIQLFFLFAPKDPFGESFSKIIFKSSSEFLFWKKIRKFEIGQNVPNLHNFESRSDEGNLENFENSCAINP